MNDLILGIDLADVQVAVPFQSGTGMGTIYLVGSIGACTVDRAACYFNLIL